MAGYKETPRQKMISMMYLVLYALLALNVSKEVLNAFIVVNESMESTNVSTAAKIKDAYDKFSLQYKLNPEKVGPYFKQAEVIRSNAEKLIKYIDSLKLELVKVSERKSIDEIMQRYYKDTIINGEKTKYLMLEKLETKDKYDASTHFMVGTGDKIGVGEAYVLSKKMGKYRDLILKTMNLPKDTKKVGLITNMKGVTYRDKDGQKQTWEQHNFYFTILAADITILNRIIGEVQTAEFNAMNYLYGSVSETDFKFNEVAAKVIPKSTFVLQGQKYQADVLVAAYDKKTEVTIKVLPGADTLTAKNESRAKVFKGQAGLGKLEFPATKVGIQKYAGVIEMIDPKTNKLKPYHFKGSYIVAPPALTVAPLKMNVLYIGIDNPVSISAPGIADEKIKPTIDLGVLKRGPEGKDWIVRINKVPKGVRKAYVSATAKILGKELPLGKVEFRVKRVPTPTAQIAGQSDGQIDKNRLLAAGAIIPNMRDFEFEVYYQVTGYTFGTIINGDYIPKNVKGNRFTKEIVNIIRNGKRKQKFFFDNIRAKGPDGTIRSLNPISLELK
ncbi:MAG: gliding motility protein GldM [Chlorobi bacterium]|nr:gliding motility protein GldM [Chlorobiota bacterium]